MKRKINMFAKVNLLISLLLLIIVFLYGISYYSNIEVIQDEIKTRSMNRITSTMEDIDKQGNEFTTALWTLSNDPDIIKFRHLDRYTPYQAVEIKKKINEKLNLQKLLNNWKSDIIVYSLNGQEALGTGKVIQNGGKYFDLKISPFWESGFDDVEGLYLSKYIVLPNTDNFTIDDVDFVIEGRIHLSNIISLLDAMKDNVTGDPFINQNELPFIQNQTANTKIINLINKELDESNLPDKGNMTLSLEGEKYLVMYVKSTVFDWTLFDYIPVNELLSPVMRMKNLFYVSIFVLFILSLAISLLFYRNLQKPINLLLDGMNKIKKGDYSIRLQTNKKNEFHYLFKGFNDMTDQIQFLIEKVYKEKNLSNEAKLKQLQSQINPHFLYNCLFLIKNMAKLGHHRSVEEMTLLLGDYYRYITESEDMKFVSLHEELELIEKYINIHVFRMERFSYEINVSKEIRKIHVPKLLIQPLVENALIHGLEPTNGKGYLSITAENESDFVILTIKDNGVGIPDDVIKEIGKGYFDGENQYMGYGISNVYQRLIYHFGDQSNLTFSSDNGIGTMVKMKIPKK